MYALVFLASIAYLIIGAWRVGYSVMQEYGKRHGTQENLLKVLAGMYGVYLLTSALWPVILFRRWLHKQ